jgi:hypothetical protein
MNDTLVRITAQVFENYGSAEAPHWKAKGGQEFSLMADSDDFFYGKEACELSIDKILALRSNDYYRYERVDHELVFCTPVVISSEEFNSTLNKVVKEMEEINL